MRSGITTGLAAMLALALALWGCGEPPSLVGEPCQTDDHCGTEDGLALSCDHAVPGGYCTLTGCDPDAADACPKGATCTLVGDQAACLRTCETVLDCREVIACGPAPDCDPGVEDCKEVCDNAMRCVLPPEAEEDEDVLGTCQFSAP